MFSFFERKDDIMGNRSTPPIMAKPRGKYSKKKREAIYGYLFAGPAIIGLLMWSLFPIILSLFISMTDWNVMTEWNFIGLKNYISLFIDDIYFYGSLKATFYYAGLSVVATNIVALVLALMLNSNVRGLTFFRTCFYVPTIVPIVAQSLLWGWLYNVDYGLFNNILTAMNLPTLQWLAGESTVIPSLVIMAMWTCGGSMVIYLAGLQSVSSVLLEAVEIDGGGYRHKLLHVIFPSISPVIFFNLLMSIIGSLQVFTQAMMMTGGGPNNRSLFYSFYLYITAFRNNNMGYACAMAWILFIIVASISLIIFRFFKGRLYYESGEA